MDADFGIEEEPFFTPIFSKIDGRGLIRLEGLNYAEFMSQCFTAEQIGNSSTETKSDKLKNSYIQRI